MKTRIEYRKVIEIDFDFEQFVDNKEDKETFFADDICDREIREKFIFNEKWKDNVVLEEADVTTDTFFEQYMHITFVNKRDNKNGMVIHL